MGIRSAVASPIVVEGRVWGVVGIGSRRERFPPDTEQRLLAFGELIATAVVSAQTRSELIASRARIVEASDETRRRIERDLHDGSQQRLVSLGLELREIEAALPTELSETRAQVDRVGDGLGEVLENLREVSRGIHPASLSQGGLVAALKALARRSTVTVDLHVDLDRRPPERAEIAAYYFVSEALTNAARHAAASVLGVRAGVRDGLLELTVRDDGVGGADPARGSGLVGLRDRAAAIGGTVDITGPPGRGTIVTARLPIAVD
jgi:signal transduction histidine kinase